MGRKKGGKKKGGKNTQEKAGSRPGHEDSKKGKKQSPPQHSFAALDDDNDNTSLNDFDSEGELVDIPTTKPKSSKKKEKSNKELIEALLADGDIDPEDLEGIDLDDLDLDDLDLDDFDDEDLDNLTDSDLEEEEEEEEEEPKPQPKTQPQSKKKGKKNKRHDDYLAELSENVEDLDLDEEEEEDQPIIPQKKGKKGKKGKKNDEAYLASFGQEDEEEDVFVGTTPKKSKYEQQQEEKRLAKEARRRELELEEQQLRDEREEELRQQREREQLIRQGKIRTKASQEKEEKARRMLEQLAAQGAISLAGKQKKNDKKNKGQENKKQEKKGKKSKKGKKKTPKVEEPKQVPVEKEPEPEPVMEEEDVVDNWEDLLAEDEPEEQIEEPKAEPQPQPQPKKKKSTADQALEKQQELDELAARQGLRSPICCILGHVDTGKTKLLDRIRQTKVQDGEAGGITQQIGASYFPLETLKLKTEALAEKTKATIDLPGLLIIDTPGHESFTNLRSRGSNLCDIAILVVDIMHGLENQTLESLRLLRDRKTPFIVALNKIDRLFDWEANIDTPSVFSIKKQKKHVRQEFERRVQSTILAFAEQGLNAKLYYQNNDPKRYISLVPTSAHTGEGIPDLLMLMIQLTQKMMSKKLAYLSSLQCTVLEVKVIEGLGTTIDVVLVNGVLREGDTIVVCGLNGPIVTTIRALLTPHPLRELRVKGDYLHHKLVRAAQGIKISAQGLEGAVAGSNLLVAKPGDDIEDLKDEVMEDLQSMLSSVDKSGRGVCVQASTLGSLEALLEFLKTSKIPVSSVNIGPVHKKDVMRAATMLEYSPEFAVILAFDVPVAKEGRQIAQEMGVQIFTANIIYHLFDQFTAYMDKIRAEAKAAAREHVVFPVQFKILPQFIFHKVDPILCGVEIEDGTLHLNTPVVVPSQGKLEIGRVTSIKFNDKDVQKAKKGQQVSIRIDHKASGAAKILGKHFDADDTLYSKLSRKSIDALKESFKEDMTKDDWLLVIKIKKLLGIEDGKKTN